METFANVFPYHHVKHCISKKVVNWISDLNFFTPILIKNFDPKHADLWSSHLTGLQVALLFFRDKADQNQTNLPEANIIA